MIALCIILAVLFGISAFLNACLGMTLRNYIDEHSELEFYRKTLKEDLTEIREFVERYSDEE